jgi:hypothetical protein
MGILFYPALKLARTAIRRIDQAAKESGDIFAATGASVSNKGQRLFCPSI